MKNDEFLLFNYAAKWKNIFSKVVPSISLSESTTKFTKASKDSKLIYINYRDERIISKYKVHKEKIKMNLYSYDS